EPVKAFVVILVLLLLILILRSGSLWGIEREEGLKRRLEGIGALEALERWADECLSEEIDEEFYWEVPAVNSRALGISCISVEKDREGKRIYVLIEFGGGFRHYGLLIGR